MSNLQLKNAVNVSKGFSRFKGDNNKKKLTAVDCNVNFFIKSRKKQDTLFYKPEDIKIKCLMDYATNI